MDAEEGHAFIKNLAYYVRTHEKALANAQLLQRRNSQLGQNPGSPTILKSPTSPPTASSFLHLPFTSRPPKPAKLTLTPHHLFYLLSRFQELGIVVGPMDVRLENIHTETAPTNYVSFLNQAQRKKIRGPDQGSIHSVSSIRSVMSTMTSLWSTLGLTGRSGRSEKHKAQEKEDLKYLYSAFTKVPCLKLAPDHNAPLIAGYEEFPFDSAVPLFAFKNANTLEIYDVDFRQFYGWDRLADHVRSLTVKRACVGDPTDLLVNIVLDDMDKRRRRSAKTNSSAVTHGSHSPIQKQADSLESNSIPFSSLLYQTKVSEVHPQPNLMSGSLTTSHIRSRSISPKRPKSAQDGSACEYERSSTPVRGSQRRASGSSASSSKETTPRGSNSALPTQLQVPYTKWRFLRHLSLSENSLTSLSTAGLLPIAKTLQSLDLSHNKFTKIPDGLSSMSSLRALNLSNCLIDSLHSLSKSPLPAITALNLRGNRLASLAGIEKLLSLERVDVRDNCLVDPTEIARMTGLPNMVDIYVHRNPLVRSYTNYRVVIFNLFRQTPGYSQDVFLDGTQPSYSERKQLADRAPELAPPPVVETPMTSASIDEVTQRLVTLDPAPAERPKVDPRLNRRESSSSHERRRSELGQSSRRKKTARRRIVDISQKELFIEARKDSATSEQPTKHSIEAGSLDDLEAKPADLQRAPTSEPRKPAVPYAQPDSSETPYRPKITEVKTSPAAPQLLRTGSDPTFDPLSSNLYLDSDRYRQKIETLRQDLGSGWLSALGDEAWENGLLLRDVSEQHFNGQSPLGPPIGSVRTASQGIVSGSRILG